MKRIKTTHFQSAKRKKEIIQAALKCFSELGYTETNMSNICKQAKASIGSVYHHYKSKEQLAIAVYFEGISEYQSGLVKNIETKRDASSGINSIIRYHITWIVRNPEWSRFLFQKRHYSFLEGADEELNMLNKNFVQKIIEWFSRHIEKGTVKPLPWDIIFAILMGPCQEYARLYLAGNTYSKIESVIRELSTAACKALIQESNRK